VPLIYDELGYVPLAETACELMFQVIADRAEKAAVIVTTNLPFSLAEQGHGPSSRAASRSAVARSITSKDRLARS
jgi:DNA replication protein DnaC